jgi:TMEM175 potassium channel family protein
MAQTDDHLHPNETQRIEAFSDGVFAIAITLLIIEIGVPHVTGDESLSEALGDLWPSYGAYVLSFVMIGIYWANHHSFFRLFVRTDHYFLILNVVFLMAIAFLPFPTAVLGEYLNDSAQRDTAVRLYALGLLLPALGWFAVWMYANARGLVDERLAPEYLRLLTAQYLLSNVLYAGALMLSFLDPWVALTIVVGLTLLYLLPPRRPRYTS